MLRVPSWTALASFILLALPCASLAQTTTRVSVDSLGAQGNGEGFISSISADGRWIAFESTASNHVPGDTNGVQDVFVHDRVTGVTELASVSSTGAAGDNGSRFPSLSADGRYVVFLSFASTLVPGSNGAEHIYVRDRLAGTTERCSVNSAGVPGNGDSHYGSISSDGRYVSFWSFSTNLSPGTIFGQYQVYVHDRQADTTQLVSTGSTGTIGNGFSWWQRISANGQYVVFMSSATNLIPNDSNGFLDIYVRDVQAATTARVSIGVGGAQANWDSYFPAISADGSVVAFMSDASNLVPNDTNNTADIFRTDLLAGTTTRVSVDSGSVEGNGLCYIPSISADGRYVVYYSYATNLVSGDGNAVADVFVHDAQLGTTERVSVDTGGIEANGDSYRAFVSADGRYVAFASSASNLVGGDTNGFVDMFVRDRGLDFFITPFCFGDGTGIACPCGNTGQVGRGCENSISTGGAVLAGSGEALLSSDTLLLTASGERPTSVSVFWQGGSEIAPRPFGDGVGCMGPPLKRLYARNAVGGIVSAPQGSDLSVSARSASVGDPISPGASRIYHTFYRDGAATFCPEPAGSSFNTTGGLRVRWGP